MNTQYTFTVTTEDRSEIKIYSQAIDSSIAIDEALSHIRTRLKHGDNVSQEEERTLERLRELLYIGD